jgi:hypothetical protein
LDTARGRLSQASTRTLIFELVLLALILWVAHYSHFQSLGLYEDDYSHTSPVLGWGLADLGEAIWSAVVGWDVGRPLGLALSACLAFIGAKLGGLAGIYVMAYLVQVANAVLVYFLFRRLGHARVAVLGALVFGLFPADTTHTFIMHALGLHTSLTFLLLAAHSYLSGRKLLAYLLGMCCLLVYETPYTVFLAIPLLLRPWDGRLRREMLRHIGIWVATLLLVIIARALVGEGRIESVPLDFSAVATTARHTLAALMIGPAVSSSLFWVGPTWTLSHWNVELTIAFLVCLPLFAWMFARLGSVAMDQDSPVIISLPFKLPGQTANSRLTVHHPQRIKLLLAGLLMLSIAYGFSFTHYPPTATYGRLTSVHLAAALGAALLSAGLVSLLFTLVRRRWLHTGVVVLLAGYLSWVVAYRLSIQQDFVKAWEHQKAFWSSVTQQVPDLQDGTIILVVGSPIPETHFIETFSWADPIILPQLFRFPETWSTPPRLFVVPPNWAKSVARENEELLWLVPPATWSAHLEILPESNVVLLSVEDGKLVRRFDSLQIHRLTLNYKPLPPKPAPVWPPGPLYPLLLDASHSR